MLTIYKIIIITHCGGEPEQSKTVTKRPEERHKSEEKNPKFRQFLEISRKTLND
jgi:hypothetical protein